ALSAVLPSSSPSPPPFAVWSFRRLLPSSSLRYNIIRFPKSLATYSLWPSLPPSSLSALLIASAVAVIYRLLALAPVLAVCCPPESPPSGCPPSSPPPSRLPSSVLHHLAGPLRSRSSVCPLPVPPPSAVWSSIICCPSSGLPPSAGPLPVPPPSAASPVLTICFLLRVDAKPSAPPPVFRRLLSGLVAVCCPPLVLASAALSSPPPSVCPLPPSTKRRIHSLRVFSLRLTFRASQPSAFLRPPPSAVRSSASAALLHSSAVCCPPPVLHHSVASPLSTKRSIPLSASSHSVFTPAPRSRLPSSSPRALLSGHLSSAASSSPPPSTASSSPPPSAALSAVDEATYSLLRHLLTPSLHSAPLSRLPSSNPLRILSGHPALLPSSSPPPSAALSSPPPSAALSASTKRTYSLLSSSHFRLHSRALLSPLPRFSPTAVLSGHPPSVALAPVLAVWLPSPGLPPSAASLAVDECNAHSSLDVFTLWPSSHFVFTLAPRNRSAPSSPPPSAVRPSIVCCAHLHPPPSAALLQSSPSAALSAVDEGTCSELTVSITYP
ncbi:PREDICTED: proline-rich protein 36-like, partial [Ipomoea nil]|uniref:proline-rich protein 36-like n=1 Tax=Ipomoea nil TaxID=35883 RepID=UPI000900E8F2